MEGVQAFSMKSYPTARRIVKWVGAAMIILFVVVVVLNERYGMQWGGRNRMYFCVEHGRFVLERYASVSGVGIGWTMWEHQNMAWNHNFSFEGGPSWKVFVPHWLVAVGIPGSMVLADKSMDVLAWRRAKVRARKGQCAGCGYDLGASGKTIECPECGFGAVPMNV